ncbi:MAG TPA: fibro-slime domain-containing protein [Polyangiaceae bacterium]|nr:fibro-slime domain-containing protein [Polyangiaceae bacterium]
MVPLALAGCSAASTADGNRVASGGNGSLGLGNTGNGTGNTATGAGGTGNTGPGLALGGNDTNANGGTAGTDTCGQVLPVVFRDFNAYGTPGGHDDFEASARGIKNSDGSLFQGWDDIGCGLVETTLGTDNKPHAFTGTPDKNDGITLPGLVGKQQRVVSGSGCYPSTSGQCDVGTCKPWAITPISYSIKSAATFDQWYNTVASVNQEIPGELPLVETPAGSGVSVYDSNAFFPIDGKGFGNTAGQMHNYHFTTEIHVKFTYTAGQKFTFRGDDDLWIFVNGKLALDVGGQHEALTGVIDFDKQAATLGITAGQSYPMDIFHAERQTTASNFHIETNIKCFTPVVVVK